MIEKSVPVSNSPVSLVAQWGDVFVFQTKAFANSDDSNALNKQQMLQKKQTSYGEFNLGLHVNDDSKQVLINRMRLLGTMNEQLSEQQFNKQLSSKPPAMIHSLYWVNQVHGKQIYDIDDVNDDSKLTMRPMDSDAMVSKQANVGLAIMTADCVPIVLYQPATKRIAAIHAGWQGLACGVIKATAERFESNKPIEAWIGVCISQASYEVDRQVLGKLSASCVENELLNSTTLDNFEQVFSEHATTESKIDKCDNFNNKINDDDLHKSIDKLSNYATLSTDKLAVGKVKLNLPKLARAQLEYLSIIVANEVAIDCSYDEPNYYSYRRQTHLQQPATGRMALVIVRNN